MFSFGTQLKVLRKQNKVTQKQVAEKINITERNYQAYEANTQKPTYDNLIALADYFSISIDFLVGRTNFPDIVMKDKAGNIVVINSVGRTDNPEINK